MKMAVRLGVLALAASALAAGTSQAAEAAPPTRAYMTPVSYKISAGVKPQFRVKVTNPRPGAMAYLQRQYGTAHVWRTVLRIKRSGTITAPALPQGRFVYRVVVSRYRKPVTASAERLVYSYAKVTVAQMCARSQSISFNSSCESGTEQVGNRVYTYAAVDYHGNNGPGQDPAIEARRSSCRSAAISYAVRNDVDSTTVGTSLTQSNSDIQTGQAGRGQVGGKIYRFTSPTWNMQFWADQYDTVYFNGYFSCWTSSGSY